MLLAYHIRAVATAPVYTLSLHDALPICGRADREIGVAVRLVAQRSERDRLVGLVQRDRELGRVGRVDLESARLMCSHVTSSYAVICLKKEENARAVGAGLARECQRPRAR